MSFREDPEEFCVVPGKIMNNLKGEAGLFVARSGGGWSWAVKIGECVIRGSATVDSRAIAEDAARRTAIDFRARVGATREVRELPEGGS